MATTKPAREPLLHHLPQPLHVYAGDLETALATIIPAKWGEDEEGVKFMEADQPAAIGRVLVRAVHQHLRNEAIGYLFREKIERRDKVVLGKATKVSGKLQHYSGLDFLIEINFAMWAHMPGPAKVALIDHEMCHCGVNEDGKPVLLSHDVEEFSAIVCRWGVWRKDLKPFAEAIKASEQRELFAGAEG